MSNMPPYNNNSPKPAADNKNVRPPLSKPASGKGPSVNGFGTTARGSLSRPSRGGTIRGSPRPGSSSASRSFTDQEGEDDEARAGNIALMDELKERVRRAETASEELQRHVDLMQARLEESQQSQSRLEEQLQEKDVKVEELEAEKVKAARSTRDMETLYESERAALFKEKEEQSMREDEMQDTISRMKHHLMEREPRGDRYSIRDVPQQAPEQFAPPSSTTPAGTEEISKTIATKDKVIETLRLELAEAQIKIMEIDNAGGGDLRDIEKKLMDTKIENARLLEDNESFQLLLSEKTLNGEFTKAEAMQSSTHLGSLAEELGSEDLENAEDKSESTKRLEVENRTLKEQNKALAVYIEKIIGRLLMHKDFDNIFDKNPDLLTGAPHPASAAPAASAGQDQPPPPPPKDSNAGGGFLQRAKSVVTGTKGRPRPLSQLQNTDNIPPAPPSAGSTQDPLTAPSIPLGRTTSVRNTHKRTQSEVPNPNAAPLVNQMYRGPSPSGLSQPLGSPGLSPSSTVGRTSFFSPQASTTATSRVASGSASRSSAQNIEHKAERPLSSSNSTFSDRSGGAMSGSGAGMGVEGSPPRVPNNYTGAVMTQSRLRPLRLVQENKEGEEGAEAMAARKKANRTSWMPNWMGQRGGGVD